MTGDALARDPLTSAAAEATATDVRAGVRLLARLARVAEQACRSTGISLPQYRLLVSISDAPGRASTLAASLGVSRPTLTSLVDGLEHAGLLRRVPVPNDRRGIRLELTAAGRMATARADRALTGRVLRLIDGDVGSTVALLREVVADLGAALDREGALPIDA
jgi:DNA-binding MarR family transcriptional regulator